MGRCVDGDVEDFGGAEEFLGCCYAELELNLVSYLAIKRMIFWKKDDKKSVGIEIQVLNLWVYLHFLIFPYWASEFLLDVAYTGYVSLSSASAFLLLLPSCCPREWRGSSYGQECWPVCVGVSNCSSLPQTGKYTY